MTILNIIRELCDKMDISILELARGIEQSPKNFNEKLYEERKI